LFNQRIAQIGIVIHDQDLAGVGHVYNPSGAAGWARSAFSRVLIDTGFVRSWFVLK
jgi:hypothetical protein